jgi:hypothetical protein
VTIPHAKDPLHNFSVSDGIDHDYDANDPNQKYRHEDHKVSRSSPRQTATESFLA